MIIPATETPTTPFPPREFVQVFFRAICASAICLGFSLIAPSRLYFSYTRYQRERAIATKNTRSLLCVPILLLTEK